MTILLHVWSKLFVFLPWNKDIVLYIKLKKTQSTLFSVTYTCMFAHPLRKLHRLSPVWRETRFKRLTRIMYYVACKMKDSSITNALFILQKPCVAKADRNMSPLPSWIMLIAWYTNLHIGAKEIENLCIHSFLFSFISSDDIIFPWQWKIFLVEKSKVSTYQKHDCSNVSAR